ncbi:MAG: glutaminyl-peptide cyclotransferase [Crocinitomicaceae bacterium]
MRRTILHSGLILCILAINLIGCRNENQNKKNKKKTSVSLKVNAPSHSQQYTIGDQIKIDLSVENADNIKDLTIYFDDVIFKENIEVKSQVIIIETKDLPVGFSTIYITYNDKTGKPRAGTRNIILFSDLIPDQKIASVVKTYPHRNEAYTQGLEFYKGELFESTGSGDYAKSFLAKVNLSTGQHIAYQEMENKNYFGEGITIINDTIYQLTWQDKQCLVYDLDFNYIKSFTYEGEGWGLTNNGKSLIMSNGSSSIVWRNRHTFEIEKTIDVFSHEKDVQNLNELELINGDLWCNVYTTDYLVQVDTATGKVLANIDCSGIVRKGMIGNANVLNGIAYEPNTQKLYLTGKLWSVLYEVKID